MRCQHAPTRVKAWARLRRCGPEAGHPVTHVPWWFVRVAGPYRTKAAAYLPHPAYGWIPAGGGTVQEVTGAVAPP